MHKIMGMPVSQPLFIYYVCVYHKMSERVCFGWNKWAGLKSINKQFIGWFVISGAPVAFLRCSDFDIMQCWLSDCCNRWPVVINSEFFFKMPFCHFLFCYSMHDITSASLHISQFLNSHVTQLGMKYFCDLTGDPWIVILSHTHAEYSLWLTLQRTSEEPVFYESLFREARKGCCL